MMLQSQSYLKVPELKQTIHAELKNVQNYKNIPVKIALFLVLYWASDFTQQDRI